MRMKGNAVDADQLELVKGAVAPLEQMAVGGVAQTFGLVGAHFEPAAAIVGAKHDDAILLVAVLEADGVRGVHEATLSVAKGLARCEHVKVHAQANANVRDHGDHRNAHLAHQ